MYKDILTKEELEALLSTEELDVFKEEQQSRVEHELMLSPAHLLLAIRELEETVMRLTARVSYLEGQAVQHQTIAPGPESVQVDEDEPVHGYDLDIRAEERNPDLSELIAQTMPDAVPEAVVKQITETTPKIEIPQTPPTSASSLISRAERHREHKPSFLSKLLK
jgi:hypothetical protein